MTWSDADVPVLIGMTAVVTGTGGIGLETAKVLARKGATVVIAGRNAEKGAAAVAQVCAVADEAAVTFEELDLADLESVSAFASRFTKTHARLDLLINNAGVMRPPGRRTTQQGYELHFGANFLAHFALTGLLLGCLVAAPAARVVSVSSLYARRGRIDFDDLQGVRRYDGTVAYAQSKLAMLMFARELERRARQAGVNLSSLAAHPGFARTDLIANGPGLASASGWVSRAVLMPLFSQSAHQGSLPILYAATSPAAAGGGYYGPAGFYEMKGPPAAAVVPRQALDEPTAQRLWSLSESLAHVCFGI